MAANHQPGNQIEPTMTQVVNNVPVTTIIRRDHLLKLVSADFTRGGKIEFESLSPLLFVM
jgi:hypothetical protein